MMTMFGTMGQGSCYGYFDNLSLNAATEFVIESFNNNAAKVIAPKAESCKAIFAVYADGKLISVSYKDASLSAGENTIEADSSFSVENADSVTVALWQDMVPVCDAYKANIQ